MRVVTLAMCVLLVSCAREPSPPSAQTATTPTVPRVAETPEAKEPAVTAHVAWSARSGESATHLRSGDARFTVFRDATSITRIVRNAGSEALVGSVIEYQFRGPSLTSVSRPDGEFVFVDGRLVTDDAEGEAAREATLLAEARSYWLRAEGLRWRASGNEPFWALRIGENVVFERPSETAIERPLTTPSEGGGRVVYILPGESRREMIEIVFQDIPCVDSMAGTPWQFTAEVIYRGQSFMGCGSGVED